MRRILLPLAAVAASAYLAGKRAGRPPAKGKPYTLYQRAALLWTSPRGIRTRRSVRRMTDQARRHG